VGGPRDVVGEDGGILVSPGDARGLLEAMIAASDPDTAMRMGAAAHAHARSYTWSNVAGRLMRALGLKAPGGRELAAFL
jgi:glycosyltransferase involved in cell wall biosynthesis